MVDVQISYPLWLLGQQTHHVQVPKTWNELSADQLCRVASVLFSGQRDIYRLRIELLRIVMQLKWHHLLLIGGERLIDLFPFVRFIESEINLTDNKITDIKLAGVRCFGPIGDFSTLTADEWTDADDAFVAFRQSNDPADLDIFVAILFRPTVPGLTPRSHNWQNDHRQPYNEYAVPWRVKHMESVPLATKLAVLLWYQGCRREWEELFERVFQSKGDGPESFGWQETVLKLSGSEFGDLQKTQRTPMYKLMLKMEVTLKDDEYRKQIEKANRHAH